MAEVFEILCPRAETFEKKTIDFKKQWDGDIHGKSVLFLNDGRPNADVLLAAVRDHLVEKYAVVPHEFGLWSIGRTAAEGLPTELMEKYAREVDAVVLGTVD